MIFVGSTDSDLEIAELYRVGCAISGYGARRIIFCIPFFGYSTMERATKPGEIVTAKAIARQFSFIPLATMGNTFLLTDLHVSGMVHYFEGNCKRFELSAEEILIKEIDQLVKNVLGYGNVVIASADLGRSKQVEKIADVLDAIIALIQKGRDGEKTEVKRVIGDVRGKHVIIYDDMSRSFGTLIGATNAYLEAGAESVSVVLSHQALNGKDVAQKIIDSPIRYVITTNSHPSSMWPLTMSNEKFKIVDITPVFTDVIKKILI